MPPRIARTSASAIQSLLACPLANSMQRRCCAARGPSTCTGTLDGAKLICCTQPRRMCSHKTPPCGVTTLPVLGALEPETRESILQRFALTSDASANVELTHKRINHKGKAAHTVRTWAASLLSLLVHASLPIPHAKNPVPIFRDHR